MGRPSEHPALARQVPRALAQLLGVDPNAMGVRYEYAGADLVVRAGLSFVVEVKTSAGAAAVAIAAEQAKRFAGRRRGFIPLVAVPFMGEAGRRLCEQAGVGWLDLSGNARITAPGLRVIVEGKPNRFARPGRPANLFAPKSSRIVRWLLSHPDEHPTQRAIAEATGLDEGLVSRLAVRLLGEGYVERDERGALRTKDPALLLEAWRESNRFSKNGLLRGHVAARSGDALVRFVADVFADEHVDYAATGLAAAWAVTHFAAFRIATFYVRADPAPAVMERLGFRADEAGANLWLAVPNDEGVFQSVVVKDGIRCVTPVQAYVDLKDHPERSAEAAERLRAELPL